MRTDFGAMREQLLVQMNTPESLTLSSLTRSTTTGTGTTSKPHGFIVGDYVTIAGVTTATTGWNAKYKVKTVPTTTTFTITVSSGLTTPGTGSMTVVYSSNRQGGKVIPWRTLDTIPAQMMALGATERHAFSAVQSSPMTRFRIRVRNDLLPSMRVLWTPSAPAGALRKTMVITGLPLFEDGRTWQFLEAVEVGA